MKTTLRITAATATLILLAGCTTANNTPTPSTPQNSTSTATASTQAGSGGPVPFKFTDTTIAWDLLSSDEQQSMIGTARARGYALVIWGAHIEWITPDYPQEQKQWVENKVREYAETEAPVVFVAGLGTDELHVERQNTTSEGDSVIVTVPYVITEL